MTRKKFTKLILPLKDKAFRLALSLLLDRQEAEDTLQDAFVKLWNIRDELNQYNSLEALTITITRNLCLDKLRSYRHRNKDHFELEQLHLRCPTTDPSEHIVLSESARAVHRLVERLPEQQRLIIHLRDIEQYTYDEIEELTGLTRNNIRVQLSRARKKVREAYEKHQTYEYQKN